MKIRHATLDDLDQLASMEATSHPSAEDASKDSIKGRLEHFKDYFWIMENVNHKIVFLRNDSYLLQRTERQLTTGQILDYLMNIFLMLISDN